MCALPQAVMLACAFGGTAHAGQADDAPPTVDGSQIFEIKGQRGSVRCWSVCASAPPY